MGKISHERWKVYKNVFDEYTNRLLFKLASQEHFEELKSPIKLGKEANVFSAVKKDGTYVAVKIYRLESCNFNKMYDYLKYDPRYLNLKKQRRKVIFSWVQREYRNLHKARDANVRVPLPLTCKDHILILEYIGSENTPASMLKDQYPKDPKQFIEKCIEYMHLLYRKAGLVHADLSEYNILNHKENPVFIDFSQGTIIENTSAEELLIRDVKNIVQFAKKLNIELDTKEVLKKIKAKEC